MLVYRRSEGKVHTEPMEDVMCEVNEDTAGQVIESLSLRRGELTEMVTIQVGFPLFSCVWGAGGRADRDGDHPGDNVLGEREGGFVSAFRFYGLPGH